MTLRSYLVTMVAGTALAWTAVGLVITMTDPTESRSVVVGILYFAIFLALTGTLSICGFGLRVWLLKQHYFISRQVLIAFRQGILLAALLVIALILQSKGILTWWIGMLIVAAMTTLEFFFITAKVK